MKLNLLSFLFLILPWYGVTPDYIYSSVEAGFSIHFPAEYKDSVFIENNERIHRAIAEHNGILYVAESKIIKEEIDQHNWKSINEKELIKFAGLMNAEITTDKRFVHHHISGLDVILNKKNVRSTIYYRHIFIGNKAFTYYCVQPRTNLQPEKAAHFLNSFQALDLKRNNKK
jgi:hypothetical protein